MARPFNHITSKAPQSDDLIIKNEKYVKPSGETTVRRYIQGKQLGRGGFAKVYHFTCIETNQVYAAKIISKIALNDEKHMQKFKTEVKVHRSLDHPNIVKFHRCFEDEEFFYILLELCQNDSLDQLLIRRNGLTELEVQYYVNQLVKALIYIHEQKILHRDLKLANLLLTDKMKLKVADFGLSAQLSSDFEKRKTQCGTPNFIAPEVLNNSKGYSFPADIWSLGVICFNLLTGQLPFEAPTAKEIANKIQEGKFSYPPSSPISERAKDFINKMLILVPEKRMTLEDIKRHPFLNPKAGIPPSMPASTMLVPPPSHIMREYTEKEGVKIGKSLRAESSNSRARSVEPQQRMAPKTPVKQRYDEKMFEKRISTTPSKKPINNRSDFSNGNLTADTKTSSTKESPIKSPNFKLEFGGKVNTEPMIEIKEVQVRPQTSNNNGLRRGNTERILTSEKKNIESAKNLIPLKTFAHDMRLQTQTMFRKQGSFTPAKEEIRLVQKVKFTIKQEERKEKEAKEDQDIEINTNYKKKREEEREKAKEKEKAEVVKSWPIVRILQWMDHTAGYGLGYTFSDGTIGILYNDKTKMVLDAQGESFQFIKTGVGKKDIVTKHLMTEIPTELKGKVMDMQQFVKLFTKGGKMSEGITPNKNNKLLYVKKWLNTKYATLFRMNNEDLQVAFVDNSLLVLNHDGKKLKYVTKRGELNIYNLDTDSLSKDKGAKKRYIYTLEVLEKVWNKKNESEKRKNGEKVDIGNEIEL